MLNLANVRITDLCYNLLFPKSLYHNVILDHFSPHYSSLWSSEYRGFWKEPLWTNVFFVNPEVIWVHVLNSM